MNDPNELDIEEEILRMKAENYVRIMASEYEGVDIDADDDMPPVPDGLQAAFVKKDIIRDARTGEVLEVRAVDLTADELVETLRSEHPELD